MSEQRDNREGDGIQMVEARRRREREPATMPARPWGPQGTMTRPRPPARMPNGDPPSLMLWGAEDA